MRLLTVRVIVVSLRDWAHYMARLVDGGVIFAFYAALYRYRLVPGVLAGFSLIAAVLMVTAVGMLLFGHEVVLPLLLPMAVSQLLVALWLIAKGWQSQPSLGETPA